VIALTTFSVNIDTEKNTKLYKALKHFVGEEQAMGPIFPLSSKQFSLFNIFVHIFSNRFKNLTLFKNAFLVVFPILSRFTPAHPLDHSMVDQFYEILDARRQQKQQNPDAQTGINDLADIIFECLPLVDNDEAYKRLKITKRTLIAQAFNLFLAGMDRICSAMVFFCYEMGKNPDLQQRIHNEIDEFVKNYDEEQLNKTTDEMASELKLLTASIKVIY